MTTNFPGCASLLVILLLSACSDESAIEPDREPLGEPVDEPAAATTSANPVSHETADLGDSAWQVVAINGANVIDDTTVTLTIGGQGTLAGSTGCNRFFGSAAIGPGTFAASGIGSTRRACPEPVMDQEHRFLEALGASSGYRERPESRLQLHDVDERTRLELIRVPADPTVADLPLPP